MNMGAIMLMRLPLVPSLKSYNSHTINYGTLSTVMTRGRSILETIRAWLLVQIPVAVILHKRYYEYVRFVLEVCVIDLG